MPIDLVAQTPLPVFDFAWVLGVLFRVLHITASAILLGGLVYQLKAVLPTQGSDGNPPESNKASRAGWAKLVALATALLLISGIYNFYGIVTTNEKLPSLYHALFGIKFLLAFFVFFVAAATAGRSSLAVKMRSSHAKWLKLCLAAALAIFVIAAVLRSIEKVPKTIDDTNDDVVAEIVNE